VTRGTWQSHRAVASNGPYTPWHGGETPQGSAKARTDHELVQGTETYGPFRQVTAVALLLEPAGEPKDVVPDPARRGRVSGKLRTLGDALRLDQLGEVGRTVAGEAREVGLDLPRPHQMDARQQDPKRVEEGLQLARLLERPPLGSSEPQVVVGVVAGEQAGDEFLELLVHRRCGEHQGRRHLFQDVAVAPQKKAAELGQVVRDDVGLRAGLVPPEAH